MPRATSRAKAAKEVQYIPPDMLELDPEVIEHFLSQGQKLRWVRFLLGGKEDAKNLRKKVREGWEPVNIEEVPEHLQADFERGQVSRIEGVIINGDVALYRIPVEKSEARQKYYEGTAVDQEQAVNRSLMKYSNRAMPIQDTSQSRTTTGRKPAKIGAVSEEG